MKLAALDVGTNTVLMLVVECTDKTNPKRLADFTRITRLGRGVDRTGCLDPESAARTLEAISEFTAQARALGAERIITAATSALRDARDGQAFIAQVRAATGVDLDVISGETEAYLSYLASMRGLGLETSTEFLIVDVGGGSTELIAVHPDRPLELVSLEMGSVRLTERVIKHDPPLPSENRELERIVEQMLRSLGWHFRPKLVVGIAGTATTLAAIALGLAHYDHEAVHGAQLERRRVVEVLERLRALNLEQRKALPGMMEGRADVIIAGVTIFERVLTCFAADRLVVSDQGVRWGLIWRELERLHQP
jgi:exopolyphosphatase/guanosine-5'-triphosphate,3'-diphosphate pyrophosphatase